MKTSKLPRILAGAIASAALLPCFALHAEEAKAPEERPLVQLAILLDTSNSMDGLIAQAKTQLWQIVNEFIAAKQDGKAPTGTLDGVARALPALMRAEKIQKRAARVGFDWASTGPVIDKIEEELGELRAEIEAGKVDQARLTDELGDVLFAVANLARHCKVDPEVALRATNDKFEKRFRYIEKKLGEQGRTPAEATLEEMEALWKDAKTKA